MRTLQLGIFLALSLTLVHSEEEVIKCPDGECVKLHLCKDGEINTDGSNIIDIRFNPDDPCEHYLLKCCKIPENEDEEIIDVPPLTDSGNLGQGELIPSPPTTHENLQGGSNGGTNIKDSQTGGGGNVGDGSSGSGIGSQPGGGGGIGSGSIGGVNGQTGNGGIGSTPIGGVSAGGGDVPPHGPGDGVDGGTVPGKCPCNETGGGNEGSGSSGVGLVGQSEGGKTKGNSAGGTKPAYGSGSPGSGFPGSTVPAHGSDLLGTGSNVGGGSGGGSGLPEGTIPTHGSGSPGTGSNLGGASGGVKQPEVSGSNSGGTMPAHGTGPTKTGPSGTRPAGTGPYGTGSYGTEPSGTGPSTSGPSGTGSYGTGPSGTGPFGAGSSGTWPSGTWPSGTGPSESGPSGTGSYGTGPSGTGPSKSGPSGTGSYGAGPSGTGPFGAGPSGTGPSGTGPSGTGSSGSGPSGTGLSGTGLSGTGPSGTGPFGAGSSGTGPPGSGPYGTGSYGTGPSGTGPSKSGPSGTGPFGAGPFGTGLSGTGPSGTGPSGTGPTGTGSSSTGPVKGSGSNSGVLGATIPANGPNQGGKPAGSGIKGHDSTGADQGTVHGSGHTNIGYGSGTVLPSTGKDIKDQTKNTGGSGKKQDDLTSSVPSAGDNFSGVYNEKHSGKYTPGGSIVSSDDTTKSPLVPSYENKGCGMRNADGVGFRITGNNDGESEYGEFPWMVAILKEEKALDQVINVYQCGGSLIHPQVVLTAAHCVQNKQPHEIKIRLGEWDTQTTNEIYDHQDRNVEHIVVHDKFYKGGLFNDVALLFLNKPAEIIDTVNTACLPPQDYNFDQSRCFASGWGKDVFGKDGKYQVILKKIELPIMPFAKCQEALRTTRLGKRFILNKSFICAGGEPGRDTCKGDGGSPLVCPIPGTVNRYYQAGIVAWGIGCGETGIPGVYVNVAGFRNWIDEHLTQRNVPHNYYIYV